MPLFEFPTPRSQRNSRVQPNSSSGRNTAWPANNDAPKPPPRLLRRDSTFQRLPRAQNPTLGTTTFDAFHSTSSEKSDDFPRILSAAVCPFDAVRKISPRHDDHKYKKLTIWEKGKLFGKIFIFIISYSY